jgi:hypothetical protein
MTAIDIVLLGAGILALGGLGLTTRRARTEPGRFVVAVLFALAVAAVMLIAPTAGLRATSGMQTASGIVLAIAACIWSLILVMRPHEPAGYEATGSDLASIVHACAAHDQAKAGIDSFSNDRRAMGIRARLLDSFVTTSAEVDAGAAHGRLEATLRHLRATTPTWYAVRVEALIDEDGYARRAVDATAEALEPLALNEDEARRVHQMAIDAMNALNTAVESLSSAQFTETLDAVTDNKAISVMSSMQNSSAASDVENAREAVMRLEQAARVAVDARLAMPGDTFDLIIDLGTDPAFDFMSFYNLSRLSDAENRCRTAFSRVEAVEPSLRAVLEDAIEEARPFRERLAELREPFETTAFEELPASARPHARGENR